MLDSLREMLALEPAILPPGATTERVSVTLSLGRGQNRELVSSADGVPRSRSSPDRPSSAMPAGCSAPSGAARATRMASRSTPPVGSPQTRCLCSSAPTHARDGSSALCHRRGRIPPDWPRPAANPPRSRACRPRPTAAPARDKPPGPVRRRRRALRLDQAHSQRGGKGTGLAPEAAVSRCGSFQPGRGKWQVYPFG